MLTHSATLLTISFARRENLVFTPLLGLTKSREVRVNMQASKESDHSKD